MPYYLTVLVKVLVGLPKVQIFSFVSITKIFFKNLFTKGLTSCCTTPHVDLQNSVLRSSGNEIRRCSLMYGFQGY